MPVPASPLLVEVFRAGNLPEAHAVRLLLEREGIAVRIDNDMLQGAIGDLPVGWATAPRILVERSQEPEARALLEEKLSHLSAPEDSESAMRCLACGAEMGERASCPECGWSYQTDSA